MILENRLWMMTWRSLFFLSRQSWQGLDAHDINGTMAPWQTLWIRGCTMENSRAALTQRAQILPGLQAKKRPDGKEEKDKSEEKTSTKKTPKIQQLCDFVRSIRSNSLTSCEGPVLSSVACTLCTWDQDVFRFCPEKAYQKSRRIHKKGVIICKRVQSD